jgi:uroporphyrinogen-III synthase
LTVETVVLTASAGRFPGLAEALKQLRVAVEERPLLKFAPPNEWRDLDDVLDRLPSYGAVAFTSPRAARAFTERWKTRGMSQPSGSSTPEVWAGGAATKAALEGIFGSVRTPTGAGESGAAATLARAMINARVRGPVLFPCGDLRRDELPDELRRHGIVVEEVICYRSVLADESEARAAAARGTVLVVASPSVADLLARSCPPDHRPELVAVGPTTATASRSAGWPPAAVSAEPSTGAVASTIAALLHR